MEDENKKLLIKMMQGQCQMWDCMMEMMKNYPEDISSKCNPDDDGKWSVDILLCNEIVMNLSKRFDTDSEAVAYSVEYMNKLKGKK